jgi:predicted acylesterase/phospholipase RssA
VEHSPRKGMSMTPPKLATYPEYCDLVMKGGITSGVVYPAAVYSLHDKHKFRSIGGASAGAIAAAATAAAELGRDAGGFEKLNGLSTELTRDGFLQSLFQPAKPMRASFDLLFALQRKKGRVQKAGLVASTLLRRFIGWAVVAVGVTVGYLGLMVTRFDGALARGDWIAWALLALPLLIALGMGVVAGLAVRLVKIGTQHLPDNKFGMCSGMPVGKGDALTPWLYEKIQACAGRDVKRPVTFADLKEGEITLQMMTTDLAEASPLRLPLEPGRDYLFSLEEFVELFPEPVISHLREVCPVEAAADDEHPELRRFPRGDLPIIVATRMSLSFPLLLSAVPLWTERNRVYVKHWLSDGGIGSNFPIHFFDAWLPTRPTFGLNFVSDSSPAATNPDEISYGHRTGGRVRIDKLFTFLHQILETMQNWRDKVQAELPGFRDRIQDIPLGPEEGGMNLTMDPETVQRLVRKGHRAGEVLQEGFAKEWHDHRLRRYQSLMHQLQINIMGEEGKGPGMRRVYAETGVRGDVIAAKNQVLPKDWGPTAASETEELFKSAGDWGPDGAIDFITERPLKPPRVMRVTPDI